MIGQFLVTMIVASSITTRQNLTAVLYLLLEHFVEFLDCWLIEL